MEKADRDDWWPRWVWVGECFFWYQLTRVVPDKFHRAVKRLCLCVSVCVCVCPASLFRHFRDTLHATAILTNRLGSSVPSVCLCFVGDVGRRGAMSSHVKNLTAQTWWSTMTALHSSFIELPSTGLQVCVCVLFICLCKMPIAPLKSLVWISDLVMHDVFNKKWNNFTATQLT